MAKRGNRQEFKPDYYSCAGGTKETFGQIYFSLVTNERFLQLSCFAKWLYVVLRVQHTSRQGRECLYKHAGEEQISYPERCFVFPAKQQKIYGLSDRSNVARGMKELERAGFIELYESNRHRWRVNVYCFSDKWKQ